MLSSLCCLCSLSVNHFLSCFLKLSSFHFLSFPTCWLIPPTLTCCTCVSFTLLGPLDCVITVWQFVLQNIFRLVVSSHLLIKDHLGKTLCISESCIWVYSFCGSACSISDVMITLPTGLFPQLWIYCSPNVCIYSTSSYEHCCIWMNECFVSVTSRSNQTFPWSRVPLILTSCWPI